MFEEETRRIFHALQIIAHLEATSLMHLGSIAEEGTQRAAKQADFTT